MKAMIKLITSMLIWGSMGIIVRHINLPAGRIALIRALIGLIFLAGLNLVLKKSFEKKEIESNKWKLVASGVILGVNWIFLFEAYKHTSIAIATVCYYLAPAIMAIMSAFLLKERLSFLKMSLIMTALVGLAFVSGVIETSKIDWNSGIGIIFGIAAAFAYASYTIINKYIKRINSLNATMTQFAIASLILFPYTFIWEESSKLMLPWNTVLLLILLGVFHTGIAFWLFFSAVRDLKAQTVAVLSYLDPVSALILSVLILKEHLSLFQLFGACMILASAFLNSYISDIKLHNDKRKLPKEGSSLKKSTL